MLALNYGMHLEDQSEHFNHNHSVYIWITCMNALNPASEISHLIFFHLDWRIKGQQYLICGESHRSSLAQWEVLAFYLHFLLTQYILSASCFLPHIFLQIEKNVLGCSEAKELFTFFPRVRCLDGYQSVCQVWSWSQDVVSLA